ncbi:E3 ubiquitin-protein ligase [Melia azedarach]|uniref:E3 ubiquitin-protein ligase n=2 Tax=Melia azedarach TaxID=155640 RepID=A0ACC1X755_MELAZ|nr:E3 ubiquitin-protein ligase [Melia azedarach]KAJ4706953.1 E3 ubiquitin-protein ligase [Melia azedarach]
MEEEQALNVGSSDRVEGENCVLPPSFFSPIVFLDAIWNLAFVVVSVIVLFSTFKEKPSTPLRIWVSGYALQCVLHVGFVYLEYRRKSYYGHRVALVVNSLSPSLSNRSVVKRLGSINTMISSMWWVVGFYWIVVGGQALLRDSPRLYWVTVVFLAFDVSFVIFCIGMVCIFFFAIFCCFPIVAIAYAVATRQGASEEDIRNLPKYRYRLASPLRTLDNSEKQVVCGMGMESSNSNSTDELALQPEDSDCCICLSQYVDGAELYALPCNHHFHCGCISQWLQINATCPLCKFNIQRGDTLV